MKQFFLLSLLAIGLTGCDWMPGHPKGPRPEPQKLADFEKLYNQNCRGCHGDAGTVAASIPLNDPLYLALLPQDRMKQIITSGIPHTLMPAMGLSDGGSLTDEQIDIIIKGIYAWNTAPAPANLPPYAAPLGNAAAGATAFGVSCASCHGADGMGIKGKAGSVVNPAFLGLVSDQYLRTIVLVGRPDLGCPTFQTRVPGRAMSNEEISDVTAWLVSQRKNEFGQPLVAPAPVTPGAPIQPKL